jgi:hypothetical protein
MPYRSGSSVPAARCRLAARHHRRRILWHARLRCALSSRSALPTRRRWRRRLRWFGSDHAISAAPRRVSLRSLPWRRDFATIRPLARSALPGRDRTRRRPRLVPVVLPMHDHAVDAIGQPRRDVGHVRQRDHRPDAMLRRCQHRRQPVLDAFGQDQRLQQAVGGGSLTDRWPSPRHSGITRPANFAEHLARRLRRAIGRGRNVGLVAAVGRQPCLMQRADLAVGVGAAGDHRRRKESRRHVAGLVAPDSDAAAQSAASPARCCRRAGR